VEQLDAPDVDNIENQVDRTSQQMEKMVPELLEDGTMITTVGLVGLI
jgi:hypothetical protein